MMNAFRSGIIPARAGFTRAALNGKIIDQDHPRSRGVYVTRGNGFVVCQGSSPLARGLPDHVRSGGWRGGIIPARAGFTGNGFVVCQFVKDHPRSRGVYEPISRPSATVSGSSPLARGLLDLFDLRPVNNRIIPARAGFTAGALHPARLRPDHPRSRGVYRQEIHGWHIESGSSPLARGLPFLFPFLRGSGGIIPARAGFTRVSGYKIFQLQDHPRSRGVYRGFDFSSTRPIGSSPLARGLPPHPVPPRTHERIIPARAGFTS